MPKIFLYAALFVLFSGQTAVAQPRRNNQQTQPQQAQPSPSPTATSEPRNDIGNASEAERERYQEKRDAYDDALKAEQLRQNWFIVYATIIIAIATVLNLLVAVIYVLISRSQLREIKKQAKHAGEQVEKMREALIAAEKAEEKRLLAMQGQWKAMDEGLEEQRKLVAQNERMAITAEQSLRISQRAYVGVKMNPSIAWDENGRPIVILYLANTGHTPAQEAELAFEFLIGGDSFKDCKKEFTIDAHTDKSIDCVWRGDVTLDPIRRDLIDNNDYILFFEAELHYWDVWDESQAPVTLRYTYNPKTLAMEEFFEGEIQHQQENEDWNSKIDPSLG